MAHCKGGNALVLVLLVTSLGGLLALMSAKTSIWYGDFTHSLIAREQIMCVVQGLLRCGMARAERDFDLLCKEGASLHARVTQDDQTYILSIEPYTNQIAISCSLGGVARMSARLCKDQRGQIHVRDFQR